MLSQVFLSWSPLHSASNIWYDQQWAFNSKKKRPETFQFWKYNQIIELHKSKSENFIISWSIYIPKQSICPRVNREVLFIEVSLKRYAEDIFSSCKVWQFQNWGKNRVKNCLSCTKQNFARLKHPGLVGLWATFEVKFSIFWGANFFF